MLLLSWLYIADTTCLVILNSASLWLEDTCSSMTRCHWTRWVLHCCTNYPKQQPSGYNLTVAFFSPPVSLFSCLTFRRWGSSVLWQVFCLTLISSWSNRRRERAVWLKDHRLSISCRDACYWLLTVWPATETSLYIFLYFNYEYLYSPWEKWD